MWLALETATDRASVAVGESAEDAVEESLSGARRHAGALLPMISSAMERRGVSLDDLSGVLVSDGPGSFTGLRVGAAVGKALARARALPLWTAPSLMVRAAGVAGAGRLVLAVSDALRGDLYATAVRFDAGRVQVELEPGVWRPEALAGLELAPDVLAGEAPPPAAAVLEQWTGLRLIGPPEGAPRAVRLIGLAALEG
ncbi:MAG: tRNA (adenosine(37)-N6)-threonylcarbamoyltransferase complex dimerization subunit type 1 TsaB, partial [Gemmatimonadales bacterium]